MTSATFFIRVLLLGLLAAGCSGDGAGPGPPDSASVDSVRSDRGPGWDASTWDTAAPDRAGFDIGQLHDTGGKSDTTFAACNHPAVVKSCSGGFCAIPKGCFSMGSPASEICRAPAELLHRVLLTHDFEIMETETTQTQFELKMGSNPSTFVCSSCPVDQVTWPQAAAYCNTISTSSGLKECYTCTGTGKATTCIEAPGFAGGGIYSCPGYRLPTEAEWEYAYRAGTQTAFYNGGITSCTGQDANADLIGWYKSNSTGKPQPVGGKSANAWGLLDMAGNVWEWTNDWSQKDLGAADVVDPWGAATAYGKTNRGGDWTMEPAAIRGAARNSGGFKTPEAGNGFRCARTLTP